MNTARKRHRFPSLFLAFTLLVSLVGGVLPTARAASIVDTLSEVNIFNGDFEMGYLTMNGAVKKQSYTYYMYNTEGSAPKEIPAYCVNPTEYGVPQTVAPGESIDYIIDHVMADPKAVGILANGYPHMTLSQLNLDNKYQAFYATKMALWCYLIPSWSIDKLGLNPSLSGSELEIGKRLLAAAKKIYINGTQWTTIPQPVITTVPDKEQAYEVTINGEKYLQQEFSVHSET